MISFNTGETLQSYGHKFIFENDANEQIVRLENKRKIIIIREEKIIKRKNTLKHVPAKDPHYGVNCQKPVMDALTYQTRKQDFLKDFVLFKEERNI